MKLNMVKSACWNYQRHHRTSSIKRVWDISSLGVSIHRDKLQRCLRLDVFVFPFEYKTIGEARDKVKRLGERITEGTEMKFLFMLDDNILNWYGVTLIDDPCPQFGNKPVKGGSQIEPISLGSILEHFSKNNFEGIKDFSLQQQPSHKHQEAKRGLWL